jgi:16S rRNA C1402 N4-methylase RsmH
MNQNLNLLSMEELTRIAKNEGEDISVRRLALQTLNRREKAYFQRHLHIGLVSKNYVPGL